MSEITYPDSQLNQILDYLAEVQKTIEIEGLGQVKQSYAYMPADPSSCQCPFFVNRVRGGPISIFASMGRQQIVDQIDMILCVSRLQGDSTLAANLQYVARWRDSVVKFFAARIRFENRFSFITVAYIDEWRGLERVLYGSSQFVNMTFRLHIEEHFVTPVAP